MTNRLTTDPGWMCVIVCRIRPPPLHGHTKVKPSDQKSKRSWHQAGTYTLDKRSEFLEVDRLGSHNTNDALLHSGYCRSTTTGNKYCIRLDIWTKTMVRYNQLLHFDSDHSMLSIIVSTVIALLIYVHIKVHSSTADRRND